jgi:hypothetical protein
MRDIEPSTEVNRASNRVHHRSLDKTRTGTANARGSKRAPARAGDQLADFRAGSPGMRSLDLKREFDCLRPTRRPALRDSPLLLASALTPELRRTVQTFYTTKRRALENLAGRPVSWPPRRFPATRSHGDSRAGNVGKPSTVRAVASSSVNWKLRGRTSDVGSVPVV